MWHKFVAFMWNDDCWRSHVKSIIITDRHQYKCNLKNVLNENIECAL